MSGVRVRFAPSPTGELHVGGLRTALFNYLYAKHHDGQFILRIEDTDQARYVENAEQRLIEMLTWAGVLPDEGPHLGGPHAPYRQSERLPLYQAAAERLLAAGHAYRCYCTPEELEQMRSEQMARGEMAKYDGRHRDLTPQQRAALEAEGRPAVVRLRLPEREEPVVVDDLIRGRVVFSSAQLDDQVLLKSDGFPTYHLAVVVDDHAMGITHVLRAEDWLPSTPKHLYLYDWLGYPRPHYAHLPLLLNPDRSKMSKRMGDVSVEEYRDKGYLADALVNFLALLGWNPGDDQELFSREELVRRFSIERINKAGAVFDRDKLDWMNQNYIGKRDPDGLFEELRPFIARTPYADAAPEILRAAVPIVQPALVKLADIGQHLRVFFVDDGAPLTADVAQLLAMPAAQAVLTSFREHLAQQPRLTAEVFRAVAKQVQQHTGIKGKDLWGSLRAAVTLQTSGPDLGQIAGVFGKDKILSRLDRVVK